MSNPLTNLEGLLETEGTRLYALLTRLTLRPEVAEELLQDLIVRLSHSNGFLQSANPIGYARRAAINLAFDWRRRMKHHPKLESLVEEPVTVPANPLSRLIEREQFDRLLAAMESLSELNRVCVVLHYVEQLSHEDIGRQIKRTPHQVRAMCYKGIKQLRQLMLIDPNRPKQKEMNNG